MSRDKQGAQQFTPHPKTMQPIFTYVSVVTELVSMVTTEALKMLIICVHKAQSASQALGKYFWRY